MKPDGPLIVHDLPVKLAIKATAIEIDNDDSDSAMPAELRTWLKSPPPPPATRSRRPPRA